MWVDRKTLWHSVHTLSRTWTGTVLDRSCCMSASIQISERAITTDPPVFGLTRPHRPRVRKTVSRGTGRCTDSGLHAETVFFHYRRNKIRKTQTVARLSLAVESSQTLASWCVHRPVRAARLYLPGRSIWGRLHSDVGVVWLRFLCFVRPRFVLKSERTKLEAAGGGFLLGGGGDLLWEFWSVQQSQHPPLEPKLKDEKNLFEWASSPAKRCSSVSKAPEESEDSSQGLEARRGAVQTTSSKALFSLAGWNYRRSSLVTWSRGVLGDLVTSTFVGWTDCFVGQNL